MFAARAVRRVTRTSSLAFEDDRRSLMRRLARMPEECVAIRFDGSTTSAGELLRRLEDALLLPYPVAGPMRPILDDRPRAHAFKIARLIGLFCDRARSSNRADAELRVGYREVSDQLSAFGL